MHLLSHKDIKSYHDNGYIIVRDLFSYYGSISLLHSCYDIVQRQLKRRGFVEEGDSALFKLFELEKECLFNCGKIMQSLPDLHRMGLDSKLLDKLYDIGVKSPVISTKPVLFFHHKNLAIEEIYYRIGQHRDYYSVAQSTNDCVIWTPLIDLTPDIGPLEISPGSHKVPFKFNKFQNSFGLEKGKWDFIPVDLGVGDAVIFDVKLVHRSGNNVSNKVRWSINFRFSDLDNYDWSERNYYNPYIYKSMAEDNAKFLKKLM